MKLDTRRKIGSLMCLGSGATVGAFVSVVSAAACKSVCGNNPILMGVLFPITAIGGAQLAALAGAHISGKITDWTWKEENEKLSLQQTRALNEILKS